jgi:hypothetical protein
MTAVPSGALSRLFAELVDGAQESSGAFILNSGDIGLLRSLDNLSAADASRRANDGATIAAHAQHVRYGLSLMNRWATASPTHRGTKRGKSQASTRHAGKRSGVVSATRRTDG